MKHTASPAAPTAIPAHILASTLYTPSEKLVLAVLHSTATSSPQGDLVAPGVTAQALAHLTGLHCCSVQRLLGSLYRSGTLARCPAGFIITTGATPIKEG